ncbi:putative Chromodomain-helicase-DNA-binding protein 4 [Cocos nucifera]|uniref:Putative Chromodomain-helicase-DNA-binding protein 4 n=1 Tax=Cocos nucifera TaxID=13894 RepID=A0A8K0N0V1_COCNU|nr:putative Chromodomain-helicase-DNA-binding protein 4 [Cocos nucifera]
MAAMAARSNDYHAWKCNVFLGKALLIMYHTGPNQSELNRLNFWGFYTILLERGDELISVATFRVYGEKVAEMPLVGTRIQYRRQGMCRLLMNELEKLLSSLGVQKLLLPAVPQLFETWTTSFGFTKMASSDRLELSDYTLLSFQDTTMCQKLLRRTTAVLKEPRGNHNQLADISCKSDKQVDCDNYSITSEVAEIVESIRKSPSLDAGLCALPTGDTREITYQMDAAHSLPISSCRDTSVETSRDDINEQMTERIPSVVAGKCEDNRILVRTSPSTIMEKPVTDVKYKFSGKCYERNGKTGASRVHLVSSIDVRNTCNFKFIYQRRTLTA